MPEFAIVLWFRTDEGFGYALDESCDEHRICSDMFGPYMLDWSRTNEVYSGQILEFLRGPDRREQPGKAMQYELPEEGCEDTYEKRLEVLTEHYTRNRQAYSEKKRARLYL